MDIVIEGDAEACFDSLVVEGAQTDWAIHTTISNILELSKLFSSSKFCWVRMLFNSAAHASAKLALALEVLFVVASAMFLLSSPMLVGLIAPLLVIV